LPWFSKKHGESSTINGGSRDDNRLAYIYKTFTECPEEEADANARFIVQACNSHEALVEALRQVRLKIASTGGIDDRFSLEIVAICDEALALAAKETT
jgi:hypothetical protein